MLDDDDNDYIEDSLSASKVNLPVGT